MIALKRHSTAAILLALFLLLTGSLFATITMPSFFGDNMVLQQKTEAAIWGWAQANSTVRIITSWNKKKYTTKANASGKWKLEVSTPAAAGQPGNT